MAQPPRAAAKPRKIATPCNRNHIPVREDNRARVQADPGMAEIITVTSLPTHKERMQSVLGMVTCMGNPPAAPAT